MTAFLVGVVVLGGYLAVLIAVATRGQRSSCPECKSRWSKDFLGYRILDRRRAMTNVTRYDHFSGTGSGWDSRSVSVSGSISRREQVMVLRVKGREDWRCVSCFHRWHKITWDEFQDFDLD